LSRRAADNGLGQSVRRWRLREGGRRRRYERRRRAFEIATQLGTSPRPRKSLLGTFGVPVFATRAPARANANVPSGLKSWMTTAIPEHPYVATKTILFGRQTGMREALFMSLDRLVGLGRPRTLLDRIVGADDDIPVPTGHACDQKMESR
jgi:hypothetical protein